MRNLLKSCIKKYSVLAIFEFSHTTHSKQSRIYIPVFMNESAVLNFTEFSS